MNDAFLNLWSWLEANQDRLLAMLDSDDRPTAVKEIGAAVEALPEKLFWEIGPSEHPEFDTFFALSPGGSAKRLDITRGAVKLAADFHLKFEILPAKPRRPSDGSNTIEFLSGRHGGVYLDTAKWEYDLCGYRSKSGLCYFDLYIVPDFISPIYEIANYEMVAWTMLDGALGEELVIERIDTLKILPAAEVENRWGIGLLYEHVTQIIAREDRVAEGPA